MKTIKLLCLLLFAFCVNSLFSQSPNVIVVIADDMGWSETSNPLTNLNNPSDFYETPVLETLASQGIAFTNAYVNGANCAPTRAAILSGQYAVRPTNNIFNVYDLNRGNTSSNSTLIGPTMGLASNGNIDEIPASAVTIAETLKTAGYTTAHFGKYHVGENSWEPSVSNNSPYDQGFDYNYGGGTKGAPGAYHASGGIFHSNIGPELDVYGAPYTAAESIALSVNGDNAIEGADKNVNDAMAEAAIDFMNTEKNNPFFMHFSNFAIHSPTGQVHARPDLYAKYAAKNATNPSSMGHNNLGLAAILENMDQTIGRLVDYLKTTPDPRNPGHMLSENTLVYFISDNGGAVDTQENGPLKGMKGEYSEGGIRSVTVAWSEAPWLANKGTVNNTPIIAMDLYPTVAEMAGASLPGGGYAIDGASQWQMLTNGTAMTREAIYWHFPGYLIDSKRDSRPTSIVRKGDYKLRYNYETLSYEMYDLINDISESTNLLAGSPDQATLIIANDMSTLLRNYLIDTSAPLPTYRSDGTTCPLPYIISTSGGVPNSTAGCQAISGYSAYWDFDAASDANDASVNGNNPNPINGVLSYDSLDFKEGDQSVIFDGTVDINYSSTTFMSLATSSRTVSAWIKPTGLTGVQEIFDEGGNTVGMAMRLNGANLESVVRSTLSIADNLTAPFPSDGNWHHVSFVYDGANTSQKLFIDGVVVASSATAPASIGSHNTTGGGIGGVIGSWDSFNNAADSFFIGKMDAIAVYDNVLSDSNIAMASCASPGGNSTAGCQAVNGYEAYWDFDTFNAVIGADVTGNGHDPYATVGVITGDSTDFIEGDQSAVFNGSSSIQYAQNGNGTFMMNAHSARTMMAWVKPTSLVGLQNIFDEGGGTVGIAMRLNGTNLESVVRDSGSTSIQISAAFPNDGNWHHVALIYDGANSSQKLYIDGVQVASGSAAASIAAHTGKGGIGGKISGNDSFKNSSNAFFTGKMDAFAVYDTVMTLTDVETSACLSQVVANAGPDVSICEGDATTLTASGGDTYLWNTGATTASINVNPSATTTYTVTAFVGGNSGVDSVIVTVNPIPIANAGADIAICEGSSTTLTASGGDTYLWSTGATTASINVTPSATTTYTVTATSNGCSSNDSVIVTVNPLPIANAGADVTICEGATTTLTASGGDTFLWSTGATTASINVSPTATTMYTVTATSNGCSSNDSAIVTVNPLPIANAGVDVTICEGATTTLTASGGDTYLWSTGETTASINVNPSTTTTYTVTATSNGCSSNDSVMVTVNPLPIANAGADVTICEGAVTTLTASGGDTYLWSNGAATASINVSPTATTTYTVTATSNGCSSNDSVIVTVNAAPVANAGLDVAICQGESTTLTATGGGTYLWSTGETTASINVSPSTTSTYSVTVNQNGCSDVDSVIVTVNSSPVANAGADVTICDGDTTTLTASGGDTYLWNTGDTTASINVSPTATTVYTVTVSYNSCGVSANDSVIVNVNPIPVANAGADVTICEGATTTLTASGGDTYLWSTGATTASINVSPIATTTYTVTATSNGCSSNDSAIVTVNPLPIANAGADVSICEGSTTTLTASGGDTYLWSTGATTASINVSPTATTTYTVTATSNGCSSNDAVIVTVNSIPVANAGADVTICEGTATTLTASGGDSYLWSTGATTASINVSPTATTTYSVTATSNGCSSNDSVIVTVNAAPIANAGADVTICEGATTTLTASGGDTYLWSTGATTASINVSPIATTTYTVTATSNGCSSNDSAIVTVNPLPIANAGADVSICEGATTTLTASGGDTYLWSTGATTASINVSPIATSTYTVTATSNGCSSNDAVIVTVNSIPVANAGADVTICEGDTTTLTASGGNTYLWSNGATTASINVSPTTTTTYTVTATSNGCSSNDSVIVTVNPVPVANAGLDVTITEGNSTTLTATGGGTYLWSTGATTASISVNPIITTTYSVTVTNNGCSSVDSVIVSVIPAGCTYSVINSEGFESGWGIWNDGGSDARRSSNDATYATTGTYCIRLRDNTSTSVATTDNLDLSIYEELTVDFAYYPRSMDNSNEDFWLQISTNGGSSYTTVAEWNRDDEFVNNNFYTDQVIIPGPFTANTRLRFRCDASGNQDWVYIDDVVVSGCSTSGSAKVIGGKQTAKDDVVNIDEFDEDITAVFYPNPFTDKFSIKIESAYKKCDIRILNVIGQSIYTKTFSNKENIEISTHDFQVGQYIVRMDINGKTLYKRMVKK